MTSETLVGMAGVIVPMILEYFPGIAAWYQKQNDNIQRLILVGVMTLIVAVYFGLSCAGLEETFACTKVGAFEALKLLAFAIWASQGTHLVLPRSKRDRYAEVE